MTLVKNLVHVFYLTSNYGLTITYNKTKCQHNNLVISKAVTRAAFFAWFFPINCQTPPHSNGFRPRLILYSNVCMICSQRYTQVFVMKYAWVFKLCHILLHSLNLFPYQQLDFPPKDEPFCKLWVMYGLDWDTWCKPGWYLVDIQVFPLNCFLVFISALQSINFFGSLVGKTLQKTRAAKSRGKHGNLANLVTIATSQTKISSKNVTS